MVPSQSHPPGILLATHGSSASYLAALLRQEGFLPQEAATTTEALQLVGRPEIQLLLVERDHLGGLDGLGLLETARRRRVPVIVLGPPGTTPAPGLAGPGCRVEYLPQPLPAGELLSAIRRLLPKQKRAAEPPRPGTEPSLLEQIKERTMRHLMDALTQDLEDLCTLTVGDSPLSVQTLAAEPGRQPGTASAGDWVDVMLRDLGASLWPQLEPTQPIDLNVALESLHDLVRRLLGDEIDLRLDLAALPCPVLARPEELEQALLHLMVLVREMLPAGGLCTVSTRSQPTGMKPGAARGEKGGQLAVTCVPAGNPHPRHFGAAATEPSALPLPAAVAHLFRRCRGVLQVTEGERGDKVITVHLVQAGLPAFWPGSPFASPAVLTTSA